jgi:hypothetical protein
MPRSKFKKIDIFAILFLVFFATIIWNNTYIYKSKSLAEIHRNGNYKNFEKISNEDPMIYELKKSLQCEKHRPGETIRVEISYFRFFIIETVEYLDISVGPTEGGDCISEVVFRRYP